MTFAEVEDFKDWVDENNLHEVRVVGLYSIGVIIKRVKIESGPILIGALLITNSFLNILEWWLKGWKEEYRIIVLNL